MIFTCRYFLLELNIFFQWLLLMYRMAWIVSTVLHPPPIGVLFGISVNSQKSCRYKNKTKNIPCTLYLDSAISNILLHLLYHLFSFSVPIMCMLYLFLRVIQMPWPFILKPKYFPRIKISSYITIIQLSPLVNLTSV